MPIYEYACNTCGNEFELLVRAGAVPQCPSCHSTELGKRLSVFTATAAAEPPPRMGPCASCGNPNGPGACALS
ncbi:MAG TPA: zinc ribbon domain-containing protein [Burkholderiaceae bacterium]|nr:zinc ribbon domain-containing protein [Burkholderiaceae bacterium]HYB51793.1 zinc ribbon domain-containing protein [Burkholderiaceae bacterium]